MRVRCVAPASFGKGWVKRLVVVRQDTEDDAITRMSRVLISQEPGFRKEPGSATAVSHIQCEVTQTPACYNDNAGSRNGNDLLVFLKKPRK